MDTILKAIAGILISLVLVRILSKQGSEFAPLLIIMACSIIFIAAFTYLKPILAFVDRLQNLGNFNEQVLKVLIQITGIGLLAELTGLICTDMGNAALGKGLQIAATAAILWLSMPLFDELLNILDSVLGGL